MTSSVRSETVQIRPFTDLSAVHDSLQDVRLFVEDVEYPEGAVVLPEESLSSRRFRLSLPPVDVVRHAVDSTSVPRQDCGLVVFATAKTNRATSIVLKEYLKRDAWENEIELPRKRNDLVFADAAGFTLTIAVVLLHELQPEPLRPHMAGTWLARKVFTVSPEREDSSFSPEELTAEMREHFGLPPNTMRFVDVGNWQSADVMSDEVQVYLDRDVLNLLLANPLNGIAVQVQTELAILTMETIATTVARELSEDGKQAPDVNGLRHFTAATRFFEMLASATDVSIEELLDAAATEPIRIRALIESAFAITAATNKALKEG